MGFTLDVSISAVTVFLQGLLSFFFALRTAAASPLYRLSVRRNSRKGRRWKNAL